MNATPTTMRMALGRSELPSHWEWTELGEVSEHVLGKMLDKEKNKGHPRPYLRNINVQWGHLDLSDIKEMRIEDSERTRYLVKTGDLLVCEGGEPGRCAVWDSDREIYFQKALHRVRPFQGLDVRFLAHFLHFAAARQALDGLFTGSTIKHLPSVKLAQIPVPLPPRSEQARIVSVIDTYMSKINAGLDSLGTVAGPKVDSVGLAELRSMAIQLKQSILQQAFSGSLSEPAE